MRQVFEKIKINSKFVNSYYYFTKDFIFFYFSCKKLKNNQKLIYKSLIDIKNEFITKYQEALKDNFSRAFKLVIAIEKSAQIGIEFEKENIVNDGVIEHLIDYIKRLSQSFTDLYIQFAFTNEDIDFYSNKDLLINEMQEIFKNEINSNYFIPIYNKIENLFYLLENNPKEKESLYIQLIYFYNYILYKMNEVFNTFINSNISYLIKRTLVISIREKIINNNTKLFKIFKGSFSIKNLLANFNNKDICIGMIKEIINKSSLYFGEVNHKNNVLYEQSLIECCLYSYFLCTVSILFVPSAFNGEFIDLILDNLIKKISKSLIRINHSDVIIKFHEFIKLLSCIENKEKLNDYQVYIGKSKIKKILFNIKKISFERNIATEFLENKKIEEEYFLNALVIMIMNLIRCNSEEEVDFYLGQKDSMIDLINDINNLFN